MVVEKPVRLEGKKVYLVDAGDESVYGCSNISGLAFTFRRIPVQVFPDKRSPVPGYLFK
jgi:precorrin-3B methylase